jgi:hypothetical protein
MSTIPADSDGEVAMQEMVDAQVTLGLAVIPNMAVVDPTTKPVPVMVTPVPPANRPAFGEIPVMTGAPKVNLSTAEVADVPPPTMVAVMSTVPADSDGDVALHEVVVHETAVPAVPPKLTVVEPATKLVPVIVTTVPPPTAPAPGVIPVMTGAVT